MKFIYKAYEEAIVALNHCAKPVGFYASGLKGGYEATWARDSVTTSLGASLVDKKFSSRGGSASGGQTPFKNAFKKSLEALGANQAWHGAIPNAVGCWNNERQSDVTFNSIDSSLWFIIGHYVYAKAYGDKSLLKKNKSKVDAALKWVQFQDPNNDGLPVQQPTMDWEDIFPHKYGRVLNTQALYYASLKFTGDNKKAEQLKKIVNGEAQKTISLYDKKRGYYSPWVWKYHGPMGREEEHWFDTLGNLLTIVTGLATPAISKSILNYIEKNKVNRPFPCKAIWPTLKKGDKEWHWYFDSAECKDPFHYSNAGIWPFIGGFYVAALVKAGQFKKAERELEKLALGNKEVHPKEKRVKEFGFQEWLHGKTGKALGGSSAYQGWSAGTYIYAYECVKNKKVLYF